MTGDTLAELAQWAGQVVAAAAVTDVWESARERFARLLGRGDARRTGAAERRLAQSHEQLAVGTGPAAAYVHEAVAQRWADRFADLLEEHPEVAPMLRDLVSEIALQAGAGQFSADGHSVAAGRDITIRASGGGVAAAVIHGDVRPPGPGKPGLDRP